jgi:ribosomal protein S27AE
VSNKHECPACKSYTSGIYDALHDEREACPTCGLPGETMREIERVRETHASEEMKGQVEVLVVRTAKAEAERDGLKVKLDRVKNYFANFNWDGAERDDDWR